MLRLVDVTEDGQWVRRRMPGRRDPAELAPPSTPSSTHVSCTRRPVDVVHEVVFRAWPQLRDWLDEARADLVLDRELRAAARAWEAQGRSDDDVYRGARLAAAAEFAGATDRPAVHEFVAAGQHLADREHEQVRRRLGA